MFTLLAITSRAKQKEIEFVAEKIHLFMPGRFSQIYDSGSCLGRENSDERVNQMLKDSTMFESYIRRGQSEIHWEGEKLNHFKLIQKIKIEYPETVSKCISRVKKQFNLETVNTIVNKVDEKLPSHLAENKLPLERKEFIIKLLNLRTQELMEIIE